MLLSFARPYGADLFMGELNSTSFSVRQKQVCSLCRCSNVPPFILTSAAQKYFVFALRFMSRKGVRA